MVWRKSAKEIYTSTGKKRPVFLCNNMGRKRLFVDVPEGSSVHVFYSYDQCEDRKEYTWNIYEAGFIESDFAFEMFGATAFKIEVLKGHNLEAHPVILEVYQQSVNENER